MIIHDDADMATVVRQTVQALKESAAHVGKADRRISTEHVEEIQEAIAQLQNALRFKSGTAA
ncbi:hypothetical protein [Methylobacterium sp. E-045]|uniref:hypothetical protein n=1 Tax=Methylobacterium sp. E-045 TaxID=2836575 RepID=UPI001FB8DA48|nr:hypothetical protein [Methylobacterium sp. E-045]MCJ2131304.1 hypothetical protein [Methylobacterium sp. E-045]